LGARDAEKVTLLEVEEFRDARKAAGLSVVAVNHDLRLIRKIFAWGIRRGLVTKTPCKVGSEPAIRLDREIPRNKRLAEEEEQRLLKLAEPLLRDVITAMLETGCRPGEIRGLQWGDVSLERRELVLKAEKTKTRTARLVPISRRLLGVLEMRRHGPDGQALPSSAFVFGSQIGEPVKSYRPAWERARTAAEIDDFHLADLRHEAASRFDEAGVPINFVSKMLGHTSLATTSRYLNLHRRGLHMAMQKFEESRRLANALQANPPAAADTDAQSAGAGVSKDLTIQ
jgi:integrase